MQADQPTAEAIERLVHETYRRLSTPGSDIGELFAHEDMTVAGSGQGELMYGPDVVGPIAAAIARAGFTWEATEIRTWRHGDVAWAQILGDAVIHREGKDDTVPYRTTGVFVLGDGAWEWRYWGGAEPQEEPRV